MLAHKFKTDMAADVLRAWFHEAAIIDPFTEQSAPIVPSAVRITTGPKSETYSNNPDQDGMTIRVDVPNLHDLGSVNVSNVLEGLLTCIPEIGEHFYALKYGVPGAEVKEAIAKTLKAAGVDEATKAKLLSWEGLDDETSTPSHHMMTWDEKMQFNLSIPEPVILKDEAQKKQAEKDFKAMAHAIEGKQEEIKESIIKRASEMKDAEDNPVLDADAIAKLRSETLIIKGHYQYGGRVTLSMGKPEEGKESADIGSDDLKHSALADLSEDQQSQIFHGAVLDAVPEAYAQFTSQHDFVKDLREAIEAKVGKERDLSPLFTYSQLHIDDFDDGKKRIEVTTGDGAHEPNTLILSLDLPPHVPATDITKAILQFGADKGILGSQPQNQAEQAALSGRLQEASVAAQMGV